MDSVNENNMTSVEYSDNVVEEALINTLFNNDILAEILSYLSPIQLLETPLVCKKWRDASLLAWKNIEAFYWERCLYKENCLRLILSKCSSYLKYMTLKNVDDLEPSWSDDFDDYHHYTIMKIIGQYCPNLTYLSMSCIRCFNKDDELINAISNMKKLKIFKFKDLWMNLTQITLYESILKVIPKDIEEIHFMIGPCIHVTLVMDPSIVALLAEFNDLRCLSLEGWELDDNFIEMITRKNKPLSYLSLHRCFIKNKNLLSDLVCKISNTCKVLKFSLSDIHVKLFNHNFQFVTKFELLECLEITDPNDNVIISISEYCENIKSLTISSNVSEISGHALKKLEKLKNLESLNLNIDIINDDGFLGNISKHCKKIKQLNISPPREHYVQWSKESLKKISEMENLESLTVDCMKDIDEDFIESIVKCCKKLEYFSNDYHYVERSNNFFNNFIKNEKLKKFHTEWFDWAWTTDDIISKMTNLIEFKCMSCVITDEGIIQVIKNCPYLKTLWLYSDEITEESIIYAAKKTRKRINHTILTITCESHLFYDFRDSHFYKTDSNKSLHKSPYLNITLHD